MGDHHGINSQHPFARAVEQGQDRRPEGTAHSQGHLSTSSPASVGKPRARAGSVQPPYRQQASRMRPSFTQSARCLSRWRCGQSRGGDATQDSAPRSVEITPLTRDAVQQWIQQAGLRSEHFLFPSRIRRSPHLGTRQYARILEGWVEELGLDPADYGTHSMRRTKATLIYRRTKNLRAVQLLLGHSKLESTVRYLGIEVDDALEISEHPEI